MFLSISRPRQAFTNVLIDWAGAESGALNRIARIFRFGSHRVDEPKITDGDTGLAGNASPNRGRTISWADGKDRTLHWKLPSPGL